MSVLAVVSALHPMLLGVRWLSPDTWNYDQYGTELLLLSAVMLFIECGVLFPFLPGDTLLVTVGLVVATNKLEPLGIGNNLAGFVVVVVLFTVAAFLGNVAGYEIGRRIGPTVYKHRGRIIKPAYLDKTRDFFDRQGNKALVIGRFVPFVRTFITLVAGVTEMHRRRFFLWSAVGAFAWVLSISLIGYFLGQIAFVQNNLDYVMLAILATTLIPVVYEARKKAGEHHDGAAGTTDASPTDLDPTEVPVEGHPATD